MPQVFPESANTFARASLFAALALALFGGWTWGLLVRSPYATRVGAARPQPVPFSHAHHVGGLGIDCRYCHLSVERSAFAGVPSARRCMTCHTEVWADSDVLAPVRESAQRDEPLAWTRVHDLPDFAYFHHGVHVASGVACAECHGRLDRMPLTWREETLHMEWCLDCHRDPEPRRTTPAEVFDPEARPAPVPVRAADPSVDCTACHR